MIMSAKFMVQYFFERRTLKEKYIYYIILFSIIFGLVTHQIIIIVNILTCTMTTTCFTCNGDELVVIINYFQHLTVEIAYTANNALEPLVWSLLYINNINDNSNNLYFLTLILFTGEVLYVSFFFNSPQRNWNLVFITSLKTAKKIIFTYECFIMLELAYLIRYRRILWMC